MVAFTSRSLLLIVLLGLVCQHVSSARVLAKDPDVKSTRARQPLPSKSDLSKPPVPAALTTKNDLQTLVDENAVEILQAMRLNLGEQQGQLTYDEPPIFPDFVVQREKHKWVHVNRGLSPAGIFHGKFRGKTFATRRVPNKKWHLHANDQSGDGILEADLGGGYRDATTGDPGYLVEANVQGHELLISGKVTVVKRHERGTLMTKTYKLHAELRVQTSHNPAHTCFLQQNEIDDPCAHVVVDLEKGDDEANKWWSCLFTVYKHGSGELENACARDLLGM